MGDWLAFWEKHIGTILVTVVFTFIGVMGRYLRTIKKSNSKFCVKAFFMEFVIALSLTIILALACISAGLDILTTSIVVGLGGHFGTNGIIRLICKYLKLDCSDFLEESKNV